MEVYNGHLINPDMLEYVWERHPYVNKVVVDVKPAKGGMYGSASDDGDIIKLYPVKQITRSLKRLHVNVRLEIIRQLWSTIIHECRHIWQYNNGWNFSEWNRVSYWDDPAEIDATQYSDAELLRIAGRCPKALDAGQLVPYLHVRPSALMSKMISSWSNSGSIMATRIQMLRMFRLKTAYIPAPKWKTAPEVFNAIHAGKLGHIYKDTAGRKHAFLTLAESIRLQWEKSEVPF